MDQTELMDDAHAGEDTTTGNGRVDKAKSQRGILHEAVDLCGGIL